VHEKEIKRMQREASHKTLLLNEMKSKLETHEQKQPKCAELQAKLKSTATDIETGKIQLHSFRQKVEVQAKELTELRAEFKTSRDREQHTCERLKKDLIRRESQLRASQGRLEASNLAFVEFKEATAEWEKGHSKQMRSSSKKYDDSQAEVQRLSSACAEHELSCQLLRDAVLQIVTEISQENGRLHASLEQEAAQLSHESAPSSSASAPVPNSIAQMLDLSPDEMHDIMGKPTTGPPKPQLQRLQNSLDSLDLNTLRTVVTEIVEERVQVKSVSLLNRLSSEQSGRTTRDEGVDDEVRMQPPACFFLLFFSSVANLYSLQRTLAAGSITVVKQYELMLSDIKDQFLADKASTQRQYTEYQAAIQGLQEDLVGITGSIPGL